MTLLYTRRRIGRSPDRTAAAPSFGPCVALSLVPCRAVVGRRNYGRATDFVTMDLRQRLGMYNALACSREKVVVVVVVVVFVVYRRTTLVSLPGQQAGRPAHLRYAASAVHEFN